MLRCAFFTFKAYSGGISAFHAFCPGFVYSSRLRTRSEMGLGLLLAASAGIGFNTSGLVGSCSIAHFAVRGLSVVVGAGALNSIPFSASGFEIPTITRRVRH